MARKETIAEGVELYLGDCLEVLPTLDRACAIISDPPYGNGYQRGAGGKFRHRKEGGGGGGVFTRNDAPIAGNDKPFDPEPWLAFEEVVVWGANHFAARLPHGRWFAWNKLGDMKPWDDFSDVEFAWQNRRGKDMIFSLLWKGLLKGTEKDSRREHPTTKPVALMEWCIDQTTSPVVIDPYMGSGTTGVAAVKLSRKFIGIEIEQKYFDIACKRIGAAAQQGNLFGKSGGIREVTAKLEAKNEEVGS